MNHINTKADGRPVTVAYDLEDILANEELRDRLIAKGITSVTYGGAQKEHLNYWSHEDRKKDQRSEFTLDELLNLSTTRGASGLTAQWVDAALKALKPAGYTASFEKGTNKAKASENLELPDDIQLRISEKAGRQVTTLAAVARYLKRKAEEAQNDLI